MKPRRREFSEKRGTTHRKLYWSQIKWKAVLYIQEKTVLMRHWARESDCSGLQIKWQRDEYIYVLVQDREARDQVVPRGDVGLSRQKTGLSARSLFWR